LGKIWKKIARPCFKLLSQHILENNETDNKIAGLQEFVRGISGAEQSFIVGQVGFLTSRKTALSAADCRLIPFPVDTGI